MITVVQLSFFKWKVFPNSTFQYENDDWKHRLHLDESILFLEVLISDN